VAPRSWQRTGAVPTVAGSSGASPPRLRGSPRAGQRGRAWIQGRCTRGVGRRCAGRGDRAAQGRTPVPVPVARVQRRAGLGAPNARATGRRRPASGGDRHRPADLDRVDAAAPGDLRGGVARAPTEPVAQPGQQPSRHRVGELRAEQLLARPGQPTAVVPGDHSDRSITDQGPKVEVARGTDLPEGLRVGEQHGLHDLWPQKRRDGAHCPQGAYGGGERLGRVRGRTGGRGCSGAGRTELALDDGGVRLPPQERPLPPSPRRPWW